MFLPHIYDSSAEERTNYLNLVRKVAQRHYDKPFRYLWSEGGAQQKLENLLNAGASGFPAVVAVSTKVNKYSVMRGALNDKTLNEFLKDAAVGKTAFVNYNDKIKISTT